MNGNRGFFKRNGFNIFLAVGVALGGNLSIQAASPLVILNKYNAVRSGEVLKGGKYDKAFGNQPVAGNGGSWFELLVLGSKPQAMTPEGTTVDMRGWTLEWQCLEWQNMDWQSQVSGTANTGSDPQIISGTIKLSSDSFWQNIRSGTIITFTSKNAQQGGKDTDIDFNPANGKWNVNIWIGENTLVKTKGDSLNTTGRRWQIVIKNRNGRIIFGPAGDGALSKTIVRPNQVFKLEEMAVETVTNAQTSNYKAGGSSTFGLPNVWGNGVYGEDASILRAWSQQ